MTLKDIVRVTKEDGGATYSMWYGNMKGEPAYAASVYKNLETTLPLDKLDQATIKAFVDANTALVTLEDHAIGTWIDDQGNAVVDVVVIYPKNQWTQDSVVYLGVMNGQTSIWDLEFSKEIKL